MNFKIAVLAGDGIGPEISVQGANSGHDIHALHGNLWSDTVTG